MPDLTLTPDTAWALATGGPWPDPDALSGDARFMALALREGLKGVGLSSPNPPVGCVLVKAGRVIGAGVHTRAGDPHGEIMALRDAEARDEDVRGATAYVTLEPCCHQGRTGPCTLALLQAGVTRVVVGVRDPNPRVDGGGLAILRAQGVAVEEGVLGEACARFHAPFFKLIRTGLPWVSLKLALGSDGSLGPAGRTTPITPPAVQRLGHALRRAAEAIVVGRHTAEVDDPQLTDRWPAPTAPHRIFHRVVMDNAGQVPAGARVWQPVAGQPALRAVTGDPEPLRGVEDLRLPPGPRGCSLRHLLHELAARGVGRVLVEGGGTLVQAFLDQGLGDEFHRFQSDLPAGGVPLELPLPLAWRLRAQARWAEGCWEVWR
ncbi:bifunctional diaminohydroxyphosphoribosylaminopyrimidine deaminase/5-amino-6-(5-phosphoribosylamino)uracil reductase RibD [Geothrix oryzisoli]|uniref:bifunctional diaminohydroxyphosphoribosylaminopyrimidine deaminase/5-amino-6-(5-phosphoribosylamino)uracil reductase RibD n=1 Tax=Geothrix oryzisoli TaxID=2922721 RepID=UPI001FACD7F0|nr:bifunctional diaminohydroxyphosphoribosylaminopyrimidine deaminase/5-amino-6-(5-phosphoribosylamino)uracil reductase RibD [Geothrix oryzisoli]